MVPFIAEEIASLLTVMIYTDSPSYMHFIQAVLVRLPLYEVKL